MSYKKKVLTFGKFVLKSKRISPYFFNSGILCAGKDIFEIGLIYAKAIINSNIQFDVLFGSAYKGIPIVVATSIALKNKYNVNIPYCFNRKEQKKHGEKGFLIGEKIKNKKIIILDDVVTSGASIKQAIEIIKNEKSKIVSIFVLLDREEKKISINRHEKEKYKINSIIKINEFISYVLKIEELKKYGKKIIEYQEKYNFY
ncbi:orotate phosphoribosyltransferase [Buchnera aphidicola (Melanaphis sacchari)]|uniref:Orotate phosphoribosyltransferase n=1 Tax=Buchnera aphidicola (Melanaphis sacchari) TaxID=2173854 RepID=A0A2U8DHS1_9GAMM|nr:orotate phosphoribosyltransferase [Buchnera aphidicola]AWH90754.1 orotate phosphoribosyltransferase [Buchnera aphidicola (Melanaphis sacchari)]